MSFKEAWHDSLVHCAVLGSLELHLIDVSVFVANGRWDELVEALDAFNISDHLGTHLFQGLSVG